MQSNLPVLEMVNILQVFANPDYSWAVSKQLATSFNVELTLKDLIDCFVYEEVPITNEKSTFEIGIRQLLYPEG